MAGIQTEAEYQRALVEIEQYPDLEPRRGTPEAICFDLLAAAIEAYEHRVWPIEPDEPPSSEA